MKQIADGEKESKQVLRDCINSMREIYRETVGKRDRIFKLFHEFMGNNSEGGSGNNGGGGGGGNDNQGPPSSRPPRQFQEEEKKALSQPLS